MASLLKNEIETATGIKLFDGFLEYLKYFFGFVIIGLIYLIGSKDAPAKVQEKVSFSVKSAHSLPT
jgi:hypothetical protein